MTDKEMADGSVYDIARHFKCGYNGDVNPLEHGGYFYDGRDWEAYGYASCVEFWEDPETHDLVVQCGVINKPEDMSGALACIGTTQGELDATLSRDTVIRIEIDAVKSYCGMEPDGTSHPHLKQFNLEHWKEWRIWRSVRGWIESLGN